MGCAKKEKQYTYTKVDQSIEQLRNQQFQVSQDQSLDSLDNDSRSIRPELSPIISGACKLINDSDFKNPFQFEKYFSSNQKYTDYLRYVELLTKLETKCLNYKVIYDQYPIILVEYSLEDSPAIYIPYRVDKDQLVSSLYPFFKAGYQIKYQNVEMNDGNTLSTVSFELDNIKAKTILIKTPYFHTDSNSYYFYMAQLWLKKGFNVVIQSNRGSHASSGVFKWLHEKNVEDSASTISWIRKQNFSNGKVISYGVSYDGFNALSSAVGDPEGLEAVIACSAPANAQTDSFTAGETIESWLLRYIANRENSDVVRLFGEKIQYLVSNNIDFKDFDNEIYGRDLEDWNDLLKARDEGSLTNYFNSRTLHKGLAKTETPIFYVAGTRNDQDSRDTILAYNYVKKNDSNPSNHHLYIHHEGHGCGDFLKKEIGQKFLNGDHKELKSEYKKSYLRDDVYELNTKPFTRESIQLISLSDVDSEMILSDRYDLDSDNKDITLGLIAQEDLIINGVMNLEIEGTWNMYNSTIIPSLYYTVNGEAKRIHNMMDQSSRSAFHIKSKQDQPTVLKLTLPPSLFSVKKGELIFITLEVKGNDYLDIFMNQRSEYYSKDESRGYFHIHDTGKNILNISVELKEKPPLELEEVSKVETEEQGSTTSDIL